MKFEEALALLRSGKAVGRTAWNETGKWLEIHYKNNEQCLFSGRPGKRLRPWIPGPGDILADDWVEDKVVVIGMTDDPRQTVMFSEET